MLDVVAAAFMDGWAFVREATCFYLVRPPYGLSTKVTVDESTVRSAVAKHGFTPEHAQFSTWHELLEFLRSRMVDAYRAAGASFPSDGVGADIIASLPAGELHLLLEEVQANLADGSGYGPAAEVAADVLASDAASTDADLRRRAHDLLSHARDLARKHNEARRALRRMIEPEAVRQCFPSAAQAHGPEDILSLGESIAARGTVLPLGAR